MKIKDVSQRVEVDATLPAPIASVSFGISPDVTTGGDHVVDLDAEDTNEDVELFADIGSLMNP